MDLSQTRVDFIVIFIFLKQHLIIIRNKMIDFPNLETFSCKKKPRYLALNVSSYWETCFCGNLHFPPCFFLPSSCLPRFLPFSFFISLKQHVVAASTSPPPRTCSVPAVRRTATTTARAPGAAIARTATTERSPTLRLWPAHVSPPTPLRGKTLCRPSRSSLNLNSNTCKDEKHTLSCPWGQSCSLGLQWSHERLPRCVP